MRPPRAKIKPKDEAVKYASLGQDKDGFEVKFINSVKGRGVFSRCNYNKGDFLLEYRRDVVTQKEYENRTRLYHDALKVFLFEFWYNGKQLCQSKMRTITVNGQPHLCLFAIKDIKPGEEITYNYGDSYWPWRVKVSEHPDCPQADVTMALSSLKDDEQVTNFLLLLLLQQEYSRVVWMLIVRVLDTSPIVLVNVRYIMRTVCVLDV
ncbi:hypothetical protein ACER0C_002929 [Sarotherodon galilaeus]